MYEAGGGECGDGDLLRILKDEEEGPSVGAIIGMCLHFGIEKDNRRTIDSDGAWEYFYELFAVIASSMTRDELYEFFESDLFPREVDEYLAHINQQQRKTA